MNISTNMLHCCHMVALISDPITYDAAQAQHPLLVDRIYDFTRLTILLSAIQVSKRSGTVTLSKLLDFLDRNSFQDILDLDKELFIEQFIEIAFNEGLVSSKYYSESDIEVELTSLGKLLLATKKQAINYNNHSN